MGTCTVGVNVDMVALLTPRGPVTNLSQQLDRIVQLHNVGLMSSLLSLANQARISGGTVLDVCNVMLEWTQFFSEFSSNLNSRLVGMGDNLRNLERPMSAMDAAMVRTANVDDINAIFSARWKI